MSSPTETLSTEEDYLKTLSQSDSTRFKSSSVPISCSSEVAVTGGRCTVSDCPCAVLRPHFWFKSKCQCTHLISEHMDVVRPGDLIHTTIESSEEPLEPLGTAQIIDLVVRSKSQKTDGSVAFSETLTGHVDQCIVQLREGRKMTKRMKKTLEDIVQVYKVFASSLSRVIEEESEQLKKTDPRDRMTSTFDSWAEMVSQQRLQVAMATFIVEEVTSRVIRPLDVCHDKAKKSGQEIESELDRVLQPINFVKNEMKKTKARNNKMIELILKPGFKAKPQKKKTKAYQDVLEAVNKYEEQVATANQYLTTFQTLQLPTILSKVQTAEYQRIHGIKAAMNAYSMLLSNYSTQMSVLADAIKSTTNSCDPSSDMNNFVKYVTTRFTPSSQVSFEYDLSISIRELMKKLSQDDPSIFQKKLTDILAKQKQEGYTTLELPRAFLVLKKAVRALGGFRVEGIFRICAEYDEMNLLFVALQDGDMDIKVSTPHVPASVLKKWLRDLEDPLIPAEFYEQAMQIGRSSSTTASEVTDFVKKLPLSHRRVVESLVLLMREVAAPENAAINKMDVNNLSVVFAPCFLRPASGDPTEMMMNAKTSIAFIVRLVEQLVIVDYPYHQEEELQATFQIVSRTVKEKDIEAELIDDAEDIDEKENAKEEQKEEKKEEDLPGANEMAQTQSISPSTSPTLMRGSVPAKKRSSLFSKAKDRKESLSGSPPALELAIDSAETPTSTKEPAFGFWKAFSRSKEETSPSGLFAKKRAKTSMDSSQPELSKSMKS